MNVRKGGRPLVRFSDFWLGNDGSSERLISIPGCDVDGVRLQYDYGQPLYIQVARHGDSVSLWVNGATISKVTRTRPDSEELLLSAGDNLSSGEVAFSDFRLEPFSPSAAETAMLPAQGAGSEDEAPKKNSGAAIQHSE
jgi:hypothetical protein